MTSDYSFDPGSARDLEKDGVWFRDSDGRWAIFRGVNFAGHSKRPPYLPIELEDFEDDFRAVAPQLDLLCDLGCNVVRLLVIWRPLEFQPNPDPATLTPQAETYLERLLAIVDALYARGLFVFLDFHQDIAAEVYGGDGFPSWALAVDATHPPPLWPADNRDTFWAANYELTAPVTWRANSVRHTLASFWRNDLKTDMVDDSEQELVRRVQDHWIGTIAAVAAWFQKQRGGAGHPAILGYELFNEPHETELDPGDFEVTYLPGLYRRGAEAIRHRGDTRSFVLVEPRVSWTKMTLDPKTALDTEGIDERAVFSFHYYDIWTVMKGLAGVPDHMRNKAAEWPALFDKMVDAAKRRGLIPFLTELGAVQSWERLWPPTGVRRTVYYGSQARAYMDLQLQQADRLF